MHLLLALFMLIAVPLVLLADLGVLGPYLDAVHATPYGDKLLHLVLAGTLALLLNGSLVLRWRSPWRAMAAGTALAIGVLTLEEATNALTLYRACSLGDLAANYAGVLLLGVVPVAVFAATQRAPTDAAPAAGR